MNGWTDKENRGVTLTSREHENKGASWKWTTAEVYLEAAAVLLKSHIDQQTSPGPLLLKINISGDGNSPAWGTERHEGFSATVLVTADICDSIMKLKPISVAAVETEPVKPELLRST